METSIRCTECAAEWKDGQTCTDHFHLMSAWELDHQLYALHHLMVLCYHLQHPSLYSPEGLEGAKKLLVMFLEEGVEPSAVRKQMSQSVGSDKRNYKLTGRPDSYGQYEYPVRWEFRAVDVIEGGIGSYYASVLWWAESVLNSLRESGNLD